MFEKLYKKDMESIQPDPELAAGIQAELAGAGVAGGETEQPAGEEISRFDEDEAKRFAGGETRLAKRLRRRRRILQITSLAACLALSLTAIIVMPTGGTLPADKPDGTTLPLTASTTKADNGRTSAATTTQTGESLPEETTDPGGTVETDAAGQPVTGTNATGQPAGTKATGPAASDSKTEAPIAPTTTTRPTNKIVVNGTRTPLPPLNVRIAGSYAAVRTALAEAGVSEYIKPTAPPPVTEVTNPPEAVDPSQPIGVTTMTTVLAGMGTSIRATAKAGTTMVVTENHGQAVNQGSAASDSPDYSETNTQVAGVDEADIIKTDGKFIYTLAYGETGMRVAILKVNGSEMSVVSRINAETVITDESNAEKNSILGSSNYVTDMYVSGDRLVILSSYYTYYMRNYTESLRDDDGILISPCCFGYSSNVTLALVYDISNRAAPKLLDTFGQSGYHVTSRMVNGVLYLVSSQYVYMMEEDQPMSYVPSLYDNGSEKPMDPGDIYLEDGVRSSSYNVVSAIRVTGTPARQSVKAMMGFNGTVYASADQIIIAGYDYNGNGNGDNTRLMLFDMNKGSLSLKATGKLKGGLLNQFCIDYYRGFYRFALDEGFAGGGNNITILDEDLKQVGYVGGIAKGENIKSARFDGDMGYLVTYVQTDPLFTIDLSDPGNPKILGELKIPGFSEYLHPYDDGLMFGFGKSAVGNMTDGLKLSMFDVSDPKNPKEKHSIKLEYHYSSVSGNHRAILVNRQRDLIAFPADNAYLIYGYTPQNGFTLKATIKSDSGNYFSDSRGLYIGSFFYVCDSQRVIALTLPALTKAAEVKLF
ncbi:MAG: beta-propeller domain-containing protein [Oscillospiraceae bacterium]|nr:beta-propeller domain-containing protein [Oscillospiraceae bacterium]